MNVAISPEVELALRKQVERAVRPVHAGKARKLAMREELLAHLSAIYADERPRQPDDQSAAAAAFARFGEAGALTSELSASVSWAEAAQYHVDRGEDAFNGTLRRWFCRQSGESSLSFALREIGILALFNLILFFGIPLLAILLFDGVPRDRSLLTIVPMLFLLNMVSQIFTIEVTRRMVRSFSRNSRYSRWIWACVQAQLWSLLAAALTLPFHWIVSGSLPTPQEVADVALSFSVGLSPFIVFSVWCLNFAQLHHQKLAAWTTLTLNE